LKVDILASGSSGNCIAITVGESTILIDAGIAKTKIEKALLNVGIRPDNVEAIFITHAHGDHVKGLPIANKYKIPVYAGEGEWKKLQSVDSELMNPIKMVKQIGEFKVVAFPTHHDSLEPLGYVVLSNEIKVAICLDTGQVDSIMLNAMAESNIYIIEANHEPKMVEASNYPNSVKVRVLSHIGHLSNEQTADTLSKLVQGKGEQIYLVHLSSSNNLPGLAKMTVMRSLKNKGFIAGKHYEIEVF